MKRTAKQRIERAVDKAVLWPGPIDQLRNPDLRADAARAIYNLACDDILALWEE